MVNRRFEYVRNFYTRCFRGTLRYRPVVLTLVGIVAAADGSVLPVLAA